MQLIGDSIELSNYIYPRISPDGTRLALDDRNPERDVWIWNFATETRTRFSVGEGGGAYPTWTPDGGRIAYDGSDGTFWRAANNTGSSECILDENVNPYFFSPSGTEIVFRGADNNIGMISVAGSSQSLITGSLLSMPPPSSENANSSRSSKARK